MPLMKEEFCPKLWPAIAFNARPLGVGAGVLDHPFIRECPPYLGGLLAQDYVTREPLAPYPGLKRLTDHIDGILDILADPKTDFRVKLMDYVRVREDVFEFRRYYAICLGSPLMERLRAEIYEIMEESMGC